jgi:S-adenosylmethionine hydrolase
MFALFTDFGLHGPYTGQMKAVLHQMAPGIPIVDLFSDAPVGNPKASAYLLAAYAAWFLARTVFLCVVDPGVGGTRPSPGPPRHDGADRRADWPDDLCEIVYVDHYGNAMTGLRAAMPAQS